MEIAMCAMSALLPKLGALLNQEYDLQKSAKQDLRYLQRELQSMSAALSAVGEVPRDELAVQDRLWADDVRELSQDIEDIVERFLVSAAGAVPPEDAGRFKVFNVKMASLFKMAKARREMATAVKDIKDQVTEVANRDERYRGRGGSGDGVIPHAAASRTTIDPLLSVLYGNQKIVGMDDARDTIIKKLREADDVSKKHPKVLSIVGFGGLGKTTLAKAVYDQLHEGFDCAAFVAVSRNPNVEKVLRELLFELDKDRYNSLNLADWGERQLIDQLRESLGTKSYFIVIDDIWDTSAWERIKFAFVDSSYGSRIITTTRNVDVSKACCHFDDELIHKMKPLSQGDSKNLFYKRIFTSETGCPPQFEQVSMDILKKCGGVPLAIITLASFLGNNQKIKPEAQWHDLLKSVGPGLTNGGSVEQMKKILALSYYDLPSHLKICAMYLSIFPEDCCIARGRLIRRWIAEGFIQGDNLFELGESYFNELINRSIIQPTNDKYGDEPCCVHDIMLDLICDLASEANFVTVADAFKVNTPFERKIRRLSFQKAELTNTRLATSSMSQVRSFTIFSPAINQILPLSRFEVLRVLDLEDCDLGESGHRSLRCVGDLLHLRYLGLRNTRLSKIPIEIRNLLFLQTLDLDGLYLGVEGFPASVSQLRSLMCLCVYGTTSLPVGYKKLTSLQELTDPVFTQDCDPEELRYLTELRVLQFRLPPNYPPWKLLILLESVDKLQKLQSLGITHVDAKLGDWVPSSPQLHNLTILGGLGWYETMPTRISSSSFPLLSNLYIQIEQVWLKDIQVLGTLPALRTLCVESFEDTSTEEERATQRTVMLSPDAFPCTQMCEFQNVLFAPYMFPQGAMPMVQELKFGLLVSDILDGGEWDLCMRNLPSLKYVCIKVYGAKLNSERHSKANAAVERAAADHPNRPRAEAF